MYHYSLPSQHLDNYGDSERPYIPLNQDNFFPFREPAQPTQLTPKSSNGSSDLAEKKLELLKRLLLLQKQKNVAEVGDPSFLLDENFELSPKNYTKLFDYTKKTAQKLNALISQSSDLFSTYLNGFQKPEPIESAEETLNYMCSPSLDSNSTRDSDQFSDINQSSHSGNSTPKNSMRVKDINPKINRAWDNEKDKLLIKLVCKYNKDWKKVHEGLYNVYQAKYKIDFLKERYREMYYSNQKLNKYTQKSNKFVQESSAIDEEHVKEPSLLIRKNSANGFKEKRRIETARKNLLENLTPETPNFNNFNPMNTVEDKESLQLFFTKDEHTVSKNVEVPWFSFDFDSEFGQQDQLFERVTPCFN